MDKIETPVFDITGHKEEMFVDVKIGITREDRQ